MICRGVAAMAAFVFSADPARSTSVVLRVIMISTLLRVTLCFHDTIYGVHSVSPKRRRKAHNFASSHRFRNGIVKLRDISGAVDLSDLPPS